MKKLLIFILLWFNLWYSLLAQNKYIDSLRNLEKTSLQSIKIIAIQHVIADWYRSDEQYPKAIQEAEKSLALALKTPNGKLEVTKAYWLLSNIYANTEDFEKSQEYVNKAYYSAMNQQGSLAMAYANYASAVLHSILYDSKKTVELLHTALSQIENKEEAPLLTARIYYQLYGIYTEWNDEQQALNYADKALEFSRKSGNMNLLANVYTAMAVVHSYQYEKTGQKQYLDSIMLSLDHAIAMYHDYPGAVFANTYAYCRNNKASYYLKYYDKKDPAIKQKIQDNVSAALAVVPSTNDVAISSSYGILSELSMQENDLVSAEAYLTKAYTIIGSKKKPYYHTLINVLNSLVSLNTKKGDFKKALEYQQKATEYSNFLFNEEEAATTKRLEAQFGLSKKEQEIKTLQEKAHNQQQQKYLFIGLIGLGLLGGFFMFRSYHFNLRYSLAREKQLDAEKNEAALQVKLQQEEQVRMKAEQEVLELQQHKLQNEIMANQLQLQHKFKVLHQVKENLFKSETENIRQILREESITDNGFEKTIFRLQEVHPNFFKNLQEHSKQKLTSLDLKYCAYFYLDMDTKQIAHLLNVEPKSVRMTKYRLKQKLGLAAETDLNTYLKQIV